MKTLLLTLIAGAAILLAGFKAGDSDKGKELFKEKKCASCHTIKVLGIGKQGEAEKDDESEGVKKVDPPDLTGLSDKKLTSDFLKGYLKKKEVNKENRKHPKKFKGSDEDMETMISFLQSIPAEKGK